MKSIIFCPKLLYPIFILLSKHFQSDVIQQILSTDSQTKQILTFPYCKANIVKLIFYSEYFQTDRQDKHIGMAISLFMSNLSLWTGLDDTVIISYNNLDISIIFWSLEFDISQILYILVPCKNVIPKFDISKFVYFWILWKLLF